MIDYEHYIKQSPLKIKILIKIFNKKLAILFFFCFYFAPSIKIISKLAN